MSDSHATLKSFTGNGFKLSQILDAIRGINLAGTAMLTLSIGSVTGIAQAAESSAEASPLPEVSVVSSDPLSGALPPSYAGGQVATGSQLGVLGDVDVMDAPFSVTAYTEQLMADQQSWTVGEVLRADPSVRFTTPAGHNAENFTIRGFEINSSDLAFNGLYGLLPQTHVPTQLLERVEVFRGSSAMLSGISPTGAVGGVINLVPKRAGNEPLTRLSALYESNARFGLGLDVGQRFGDAKEFGLRFNGLLSDGESSLEDQDKQERLASLGLDYRGKNWRLELDAYVSTQDQSNGSPLMVGFSSLKHVLSAPDASLNTLRGTYAKQQTEAVLVRGEYDLSKQWIAYAALGYMHYDYEGYLNGTRVVVLNDAGDARGQTYNQQGYTENLSGEAGVRGNFLTGSVAHQVNINVSLLNGDVGAGSVSNSPTYTTNIYNPIPNPTLANPPGSNKQTSDNSYTGLSLVDTMSILDESVLLTLGARLQQVEQKMATPTPYDEQAVTPLVGLVVKPWGKDVSLYANYIQGLSQGVTVGSTYANVGETLAPYKTTQAEAGVKWDAGRITNTLSLFRISKPSTVVNSNGTALPTLALDGDQRNTGLEWTIFGEIIPSVRLLGGAAYINGEQVRAAVPANNGKTAPGVPEWTANLGAEWDTPWVQGLALSALFTYTGAQYLDAANTLEIPSWNRWDVGARYATRIADKDVVFRAGIENLADSNYWAGRFNEGFATVGEPRTYKLSVTTDF